MQTMALGLDDSQITPIFLQDVATRTVRECSSVNCHRLVDPSKPYKMCIKCRSYYRERSRMDAARRASEKYERLKTASSASSAVAVVQRKAKVKSGKTLATRPEASSIKSVLPQERTHAQLQALPAPNHVELPHFSAPPPPFLQQYFGRIRPKEGSRLLSATSDLLKDLAKEREGRALLPHYDEHGCLIQALSATQTGSKTNRMFDRDSLRSKTSTMSAKPKHRTSVERPITKHIVDSQSTDHLTFSTPSTQSTGSSLVGSLSLLDRHVEPLKTNKLAIDLCRGPTIKIPGRSSIRPKLDMESQVSLPVASDTEFPDFNNYKSSIPTSVDIAGWDSELSELTSSSTLVSKSEEPLAQTVAPASSLMIRISAHQWQRATEGRHCNHCKVALAHDHHKKQCPRCLLLFREYRRMRKEGTQIPEGFLRIRAQAPQELQRSKSKHIAPPFQQFSQLAETLHQRLDEFIHAHAQYQFIRDAKNGVSEARGIVRFAFWGECSTIICKPGNLVRWEKSMRVVREKLQDIAGVNLSINAQFQIPEGGIMHHFVGEIDVPVALMIDADIEGTSISPEEASHEGIQEDTDEDMDDIPILELPSDEDTEHQGSDTESAIMGLLEQSAPPLNLAQDEPSTKVVITTLDHDIDKFPRGKDKEAQTANGTTNPQQIYTLNPSPQTELVVVLPKTMRVEVEIAVMPDDSHNLLPGQRILVCFQLLG